MELLLLYVFVTSGLLIISHGSSLTWNPWILRRLPWALLQIKRFNRRWFIVISTDNMLLNGWIILSIDKSPLSFSWLYRFNFIYHIFTIDALKRVSHIRSEVLILQNNWNLTHHISLLKVLRISQNSNTRLHLKRNHSSMFTINHGCIFHISSLGFLFNSIVIEVQ